MLATRVGRWETRNEQPDVADSAGIFDMLIPFTPAHRAFSMEFSGQRPTTGVNGISIIFDIPNWHFKPIHS
jgi:hypothetical protein